MNILRFLIGGCLAAFVMSNVACHGQTNGDWPGWRGVDAQGVSMVPGPIEWSAEKNVAWKTELPGEGHSSPIVFQDKVFATVAYATKHAHAARSVLIFSMWGLVCIVAVLAVFHIRRLVQDNERRSPILLSMLAGLFICELAHVIEYAYCTDHQTLYFAWLDGHLVAGLACLLAVMVAPRTWRVGLGVVLLLLATSMVAFRPDPEYYGLSAANAQHTRGLSWIVLAILTGTGIVSLIVNFLKREQAEPPNAAQSMRFVWPTLAFVFGFVGLGIPAVWASYHGELPRNPYSPAPAFLFPFEVRIFVFAVAAAAWGTLGTRELPNRPNLGVLFGVLCIAGMAFGTSNYLRPEDTYARALVCLDRNHGEILWTCEGLHGPKATTHWANSAASPTPVVSEGRVYAYFGTNGLMCTDLDGNLLWTNNDLPFEGIHGVAASPVAEGGLVYITSGNSKAPYIAALDGETGERVWNTELRSWEGVHGEHRTPIVVSLGSRRVILNWSMRPTDLAAYDLQSGAELFKYSTEIVNAGEAVASVLSDGDALYLPCKSNLTAMRLPRADEEPSIIWQTKLRSKGPNTSSPVLANGLLFMVSDNGIGSCLDAETGKVCWQARFPQGVYFSSPLVMGTNVYFWNDAGIATIVACDRKLRKVAENLLPERIYASPAASGGQLFIRTTSAIWCISPQDVAGEKLTANR